MVKLSSVVVALVVALPGTAAAQSDAPILTQPVYARALTSGPVAGLPGYKLTVTASANHCGGKKLVVTRPKKRPAADGELAAVFELDFPRGLDFDPAPEKKAVKERSLQQFNEFVQQLTKRSGRAVKHYGDQVAATKDPETAFAAAARILQVQTHLARLLAYAEIPKDVRAGKHKDEKIEAFCDQLAEVAEPIDDQARAALAKCEPGAAQFSSAWWAPLCTAP